MKIRKRYGVMALLTVMAVVVGLFGTVSVANAATPAEIEASIEKGLEYLEATQNADGSWGSSDKVARTGLAVLKFETHAIFAGMSPVDPAYVYSDVVIDGLNYLFSRCFTVNIGVQPAGDPDSNGNGIGVSCYYNSGHTMYETGCALMAISASTEPTRVVGVGSQTGRTYEDVAQDIVDFIAWAQTDLAFGSYRGGWRYTPNYSSSDNSITGYVTIGLSYAESPAPWGFSLNIPPFVPSELTLFLDYIQNDINGDSLDGGSGYTSPNDWVNILKTGNLLSEMALFGDTQATPRVQQAIDYMERHWNDANTDPGWKGTTRPHYQACFTTMKGFQALGIELLDLDGNGVPEHDWYDDMATAIVNTQNANGSWPTDNWGDSQLSTCWALLTLEKAAPSVLSLLPPFDVNPAGTSHTVTAVYKIGGEPQVGVQINFLVTAGPNMGESGSDITDMNGEATFTYTGDGGIGTDTIKATAVDPTGAPLVSAQAIKEWNGTPPVPGITFWGIMAAVVVLATSMVVVLRRRKALLGINNEV